MHDYFNIGATSVMSYMVIAARFKGGAVCQHGQSAPLAAPQLGSCASSERAWRLWAARLSQGEAQPLGAPPLPRVLESAASKAAHFTAFDHSGVGLPPCFRNGYATEGSTPRLSR